METNKISLKEILSNKVNSALQVALKRALLLSTVLACNPIEDAVGTGEGVIKNGTSESYEAETNSTPTTTYSSDSTTQDTGINNSSDLTSNGETTDSTTEPEPVCGNNIVEIGEECEGQDNCFNCYRDRIMFVSSKTVSGAEIHGLKGANDLCLQYAGQGGLPNPLSYKAWMSSSEHDAEDLLFISKGGRYFNTNGELIVIGRNELLSGKLRNAINYDEYGQPSTEVAWTGTLPNGVGAGNPVNDPAQYCDDWTSDELEARGYIGSSLATDSAWTFYPDPEINPTSCAIGFSLYCIEGKNKD